MIYYLTFSARDINLERMTDCIYVPNSKREAVKALRAARSVELSDLAKAPFVAAWCAIAYLHPGLHPDGYMDSDSGWPRGLRRFAAEAWRRADAGELAEEELYPSDAQWSGNYDQMTGHTDEESERRLELAAAFGKYENITSDARSS